MYEMTPVLHTGVHSLGQPKNETCQLAKALYDNVAETPEELNFSKGDILTVLEQNPYNIIGWWICSFKGRRGLCPGNRLRLMNCNDSNNTDNNTISAKMEKQKIWLPNESNYVVAVSPTPHKSSLHFSLPPTTTSTSSPTPTNVNHCTRHRDNDSDYEDVDGSVLEEEESCYDILPSPVKVYSKRPLENFSSSANTLNESVDALLCSESSGSITSVLTNDGSFCNYTYDVPRHLRATNDIDVSSILSVEDRRKEDVEGRRKLERQKEEEEQILTRTAYNYLQSHSPHLKSNSPLFQYPQHSPIPTAYISQIYHHQAVYGNCPSPAASTTSISTDAASIASTMDVASTSSSSSSSNRSSLAAGMADYDVPRPFAGPVRPIVPQIPLKVGKPTPPPRPMGTKPLSAGRITPTIGNNTLEKTGKKELSDMPTSQSTGQIKELPLELTPALESLQLLETEAVTSINKLLDVAKTPNVGTVRPLHADNIHVAIVRFRSALSALAEFAEGVLGNAMKASDKNLASKLRPLVEVLQNSASRIHTLTERHLGAEELEGVVLCAVGLLEEVKQVASFVQGNSTLLFKRNSVEWDIREDTGEENGLTKKLTGDLPLLTQQLSAPVTNQTMIPTSGGCLTPSTLTPGSPTPISIGGVITLCNVPLTNDDKAVLTFYAHQAINAAERVNRTIDRFLHTVELSEPPKVFLDRAKHLVVNAHNLVHIGDAIVRGVVNAEVKNAVQKAADALSEGLAIHVQETRKAAEHFPSVQAVQDMVNSVAEVGHLSRTVKCILLQAAQP